jgi:protein YIPF1/2
LYPILSATDVKTSKILLIVVVALHAGLAIAIKILFFATGSPAGGPKDTPQEGNKKEGERLVRMMFGL